MQSTSIAELERLFYWPSQPGGADQPGLAHRLAFGREAVVKGQFAGLEMAADQQVVTGAGGGYQGPGIPALTLGTLARGADLPAACALQQPGDGLRARHGDTARQREAEAGGNPQHISLADLFAELTQLGAGAVDLVPADEIQPGPAGERLGEQVDGELSLGAEHQLTRQAHDQRAHRVIDLLLRYPLTGADQRMPGL